jgi:hypothetical protein
VRLDEASARLEPVDAGQRPDAVLRADSATWRAIARDLSVGMGAFRSGRLTVRHDLHLGVGFLAATAAVRGERALRFVQVATAEGEISTMQAGRGRRSCSCTAWGRRRRRSCRPSTRSASATA